VGVANLTWRYLGKLKNFLSVSAFSLYYRLSYRLDKIWHMDKGTTSANEGYHIIHRYKKCLCGIQYHIIHST
jgi:hypothetical protein